MFFFFFKFYKKRRDFFFFIHFFLGGGGGGGGSPYIWTNSFSLDRRVSFGVSSYIRIVLHSGKYGISNLYQNPCVPFIQKPQNMKLLWRKGLGCI